MKRTWLVWTLVGGVLVTVLIAFNYERGKETVPLSEIFPEKGAMNQEVEYEFFDTDEKGSALVSTPDTKQSIRPVSTAPAVAPKPTVAAAPVKKTVVPVATQAAKSKAAPTPSTASSATAVTSGGNRKVYTIQVAAFKERSRADKAAAQAQQKGYSAYVDERTRNDGSTWYQVCVGKFDTQTSAKELLTKVKQDYKDGYIRTLSGK